MSKRKLTRNELGNHQFKVLVCILIVGSILKKLINKYYYLEIVYS
jgi:hypothetical protein